MGSQTKARRLFPPPQASPRPTGAKGGGGGRRGDAGTAVLRRTAGDGESPAGGRRSCPGEIRDRKHSKKNPKTTQQPNNCEGGGQDGREERARSEREITRSARRGSLAPAGAPPQPGGPRPPRSLRAPGPGPATPTPPCRSCPPPAPAHRTGVRGGRLCAERGRRCPLPPGPRALTSPLPRQHCFSAPRRSSPLAASRAAWGGPGRGQRSAATAAGRAQSALSSPPPPSALRPLLLPRPRERRALCGEPLGEGAAATAR